MPQFALPRNPRCPEADGDVKPNSNHPAEAIADRPQRYPLNRVPG